MDSELIQVRKTFNLIKTHQLLVLLLRRLVTRLLNMLLLGATKSIEIEKGHTLGLP